MSQSGRVKGLVLAFVATLSVACAERPVPVSPSPAASTAPSTIASAGDNLAGTSWKIVSLDGRPTSGVQPRLGFDRQRDLAWLSLPAPCGDVPLEVTQAGTSLRLTPVEELRAAWQTRCSSPEHLEMIANVLAVEQRQGESAESITLRGRGPVLRLEQEYP